VSASKRNFSVLDFKGSIVIKRVILERSFYI
jgi:hypothetical protein